MTGIYLMFNGNCAEALERYAKAFDTRVSRIQKYGDMPPNPAFPVAESDKNLVLHAAIKIGDVEIMAADSREQSADGSNMYVTVTSKDGNYVQKAWDALKQDGEIYMELAPSFFALLHGSLKDRFGVNWMFSVMK